MGVTKWGETAMSNLLTSLGPLSNCSLCYVYFIIFEGGSGSCYLSLAPDFY